MANFGRTRYTGALRELEADTVRLGSLVLQMVVDATRSAIEDDESFVPTIAERQKEVDEIERKLVEQVIVTLATESPVASDLLLLTATLFVVDELKEVADEASKLSARVRKLQGEFPFEMKELLQEISALAQENLSESLYLYSQYSAEAAVTLMAKDDRVNQAFKTSRSLLMSMMKSNPESTRQLLRCLEVFHAVEHVSDRATDIARRLRHCYEPFVKNGLQDSNSPG